MQRKRKASETPIGKRLSEKCQKIIIIFFGVGGGEKIGKKKTRKGGMQVKRCC